MYLYLSDYYEHDVDNWMDNFKSSGESVCNWDTRYSMVDNATNHKLNGSGFTSREQAAARIVHMYTQPETCLSGVLDIQLRIGSVDGYICQYADLLNTAIGILSEKGWVHEEEVYRATYECDEIEGEGKTTLRGFTSTSTDPLVPFNIITFNCMTYMVIKGVSSLSVEFVSDFPDENEVLLKRNYAIDVLKMTKDKTEIENEMKKYVQDPKQIERVTTFVLASRGTGFPKPSTHFLIFTVVSVATFRKIQFP